MGLLGGHVPVGGLREPVGRLKGFEGGSWTSGGPRHLNLPAEDRAGGGPRFEGRAAGLQARSAGSNLGGRRATPEESLIGFPLEEIGAAPDSSAARPVWVSQTINKGVTEDIKSRYPGLEPILCDPIQQFFGTVLVCLEFIN